MSGMFRWCVGREGGREGGRASGMVGWCVGREGGKEGGREGGEGCCPVVGQVHSGKEMSAALLANRIERDICGIR